MKRLLSKGVLLGVLVASVAAQAKSPISITVDKETGCWTSISKDHEFRIKIAKPGTFVFLAMRGATNASTEEDSKNWEYREPVFWRVADLPDDEKHDFTEYDQKWQVTQVSQAGRYGLTFSPMSMYGWKGEVSLCLRLSGKL
ncbi:hypothetical protein NKG95_09845 [Mesorhizobium sp. M1423]|uniref:hypothetical protein n=1 Tax=Mesorhizobium sp. M1423 TaxID=2957101 RepID=UPI00333678F3